MTRLSNWFSLEEFTHSDYATRHSIDNTPPPDILEHLRHTAACADRIRDCLGKPIVIISGYRCPLLNLAVRGSKNSAHMDGFALDFVSPSYGTPENIIAKLAKYPALGDFDQIILEFPSRGGWVHAAFGPGTRKQFLKIDNSHVYEVLSW